MKTPLPHLLVYALERRLSGSFELTQGTSSLATIVMVSGCPGKVRTTEPTHFLGAVMAELGMITPEQLASSLLRMQESPRLQGQILVEMGAADAPKVDAGLRAQVERKVEHLFALSTETTFAYYDGLDLLQRYGGPPTPIDPFPVLWRGVRQAPAREHVDATVRRVGNARLRVSANAQLDRFAFAPEEREAVGTLQQRPMSVTDITNVLGPSLGPIVVYFLMIMKQVDLLDAQAQVVPPPSPSSTGRLAPLASPPTGQAFARVQLQRQPARTPLVVEEHVAPVSANDERASRPSVPTAKQAPPGSAFGMKQAPTSAFGAPPVAVAPEPAVTAAVDASASSAIGSMITETIRSSMPPPMANPDSTSVPAPIAVPQTTNAAEQAGAGETTSDPAAGRALTAEQLALKTKILERAEQITSQDYFQMLGLDRSATPEMVQKTFIGLAKVWHPDRLPPALADVKDACSKVFTHLTEAHTTLMDAKKRQDYMTLLKDGGATPDDQAKILRILEAATEFQKAEHLIKRNLNDPQAYELVKRCVSLDNEQVDYMATLVWLDAQKPEWQGRAKTLEKVSLLDRCIQKNANCERAFFYRGQLHKRADEPQKALKDFKKASELNPRNLDAAREVRIANMRGIGSTPEPANSGARASKPPPAPEKGGGGFFGKLFKK